jgi:hypothetical protein
MDHLRKLVIHYDTCMFEIMARKDSFLELMTECVEDAPSQFVPAEPEIRVAWLLPKKATEHLWTPT